jgi:hypothetical protein
LLFFPYAIETPAFEKNSSRFTSSSKSYYQRTSRYRHFVRAIEMLIFSRGILRSRALVSKQISAGLFMLSPPYAIEIPSLSSGSLRDLGMSPELVSIGLADVLYMYTDEILMH